jgi:hypothetical protein
VITSYTAAIHIKISPSQLDWTERKSSYSRSSLLPQTLPYEQIHLYGETGYRKHPIKVHLERMVTYAAGTFRINFPCIAAALIKRQLVLPLTICVS